MKTGVVANFSGKDLLEERESEGRERRMRKERK